MNINYLGLGALLVSSFAHHSYAINCQSFPTFSDAVTTYVVGSKVKSANHGWQCLVAGWCNQGGAFAPTGWASANAWTDLGTCEGSTGDTTNIPPRINTYGPFRGIEGATIAFNGSSISRDEDGAIVSYLWNFGDGTTGNQANSQHTYSTSGFYNVSLTITDDRGAIATQSSYVSISVAQSTTCPAPLYAPGDLIEKGKVVQNGGQDFRCTGPYCSSVTASQFEPGAGSMWTLTWVSLGNCANNNDYNQFPKARITVAPGTLVDIPVPFSSSNSSDADGTIVRYLWKFSDGTTSTEANPTFIPIIEGNHSTELTVTDNQGGIDTVTASFFASPKPNPSCWAPPFVIGSFYKEQDIVQYKNKDYRCLVQAYCSFPANVFEPGTPRALGVWEDLGACSTTKPTDPPPTCASLTPTFVQGAAYQVGDEVKMNGKKFSCKVAGWCSQGGWAFAPNGVYSDLAWTDLGICN